MTSVYWASEGAFVEFSNSLLFRRGTCALDPRLPLEDGAHYCLEEAKPRQSWEAGVSSVSSPGQMAAGMPVDTSELT